jgi:serine/threonine protein kinase
MTTKISQLLFLNNDAKTPEELFLNCKNKLKKIADSVYEITLDERVCILKIYAKKSSVLNEYKNLKKLENVRNVPKIITASLSKFKYIIFEKTAGEDLFDYVQNSHMPLTEPHAKDITRQLLEILANIHDNGVYHSDIKPENIIYDVITDTVSLIDFELRYTEKYASPEFLENKVATEKTDVWSVGVTLYWLLAGEQLFLNVKDVQRKIISFPSSWSEILCDFMLGLLNRNPELRFTVGDALNHEWLCD